MKCGMSSISKECQRNKIKSPYINQPAAANAMGKWRFCRNMGLTVTHSRMRKEESMLTNMSQETKMHVGFTAQNAGCVCGN